MRGTKGMAETPKDMTYKVGFEMADREGTAPIRVVAGHCQRVGEAWVALAEEMSQLADAFDLLVAQGPREVPVAVDPSAENSP
jgi:hypothetical protein